MNGFAKLGAAAAMSVLLGGCQSGGLAGWAFKSHRPAPARDAAVSYAAMLEAGKAELVAGNLSAAAASFRIAGGDPATAAEANNGLAIVYARLGRNDLADGYFRAALLLEPDSQRFAANLLRLQRQVLLAREATAARLAAAQFASEPRLARIATGPMANARKPRGIVHIRTPDDLGGAPRIQVGYRESLTATPPLPEAPADAIEPVQVAAVADKSRTYPVRLALDR